MNRCNKRSYFSTSSMLGSNFPLVRQIRLLLFTIKRLQLPGSYRDRIKWACFIFKYYSFLSVFEGNHKNGLIMIYYCTYSKGQFHSPQTIPSKLNSYVSRKISGFENVYVPFYMQPSIDLESEYSHTVCTLPLEAQIAPYKVFQIQLKVIYTT